MALPSYRSFFALMLFGWTPIPQDCEESNHLEPQVSMDAAFKQFYHLRPDVSTQDLGDPKVNTVYWFGIVFDTAFSVVARRPVTVKTINSSDTWDVVEARDQSYRGLLDAMPITNELVVQVCRAGSACKIHAWRLINRVQTAVFFKRKDAVKLQKLIEDAEAKIQSFTEIYGGIPRSLPSQLYGVVAIRSNVMGIFARSLPRGQSLLCRSFGQDQSSRS